MWRLWKTDYSSVAYVFKSRRRLFFISHSSLFTSAVEECISPECCDKKSTIIRWNKTTTTTTNNNNNSDNAVFKVFFSKIYIQIYILLFFQYLRPGLHLWSIRALAKSVVARSLISVLDSVSTGITNAHDLRTTLVIKIIKPKYSTC